MIMIVAHHYVVHAQWDPTLVESTPIFNVLFAQMLSLGGKLSVNLFILICGYFMVKERFSLRKLMVLLANVYVFSLFNVIVVYGTGWLEVDQTLLVRSLFPTLFSAYWFFTNYILLYLFSPVLNRMIEVLDERLHRYLVLGVIGLWSVIPTLFGAKPGFSELIWFMSMYVIGAYFRNHGSVELFQKRKKWVIATWAVSVVFLVASVVVLDVLSLSNPEYLMKATSYSDLNQLPTVLIALTLFVMFTYAKPRSIPWINRMATHMFGIYLVHDHPLLRAVLWGQLFSVTMIQTSPLMPVYAILSILIVFWSSFVIDVLKHLFLDRGIGSLIDWLIKEVVMKIPYLKPRSSGSSLITSK